MRGPSTGEDSGQTQSVSIGGRDSLGRIAFFFQLPSKAEEKKKWNEDWRCREDPTDDGVLTCLRQQLSWTARRWR